jgi:hypothetical protein
MKIALVVAFAAPCLLAACAGGSDDSSAATDSTPRVANVSPVNDAELRRYTGLGPATITGGATLGESTCAGAVVRLVPGITAVREAYDAFNHGQNVASNPNTDMRVTSVRRQSVCDRDGHFRFANLPEGQWVVATEIRGANGRPSRLLHRLVTARAGDPTEVTLGERDIVSVPNARMAGN